MKVVSDDELLSVTVSGSGTPVCDRALIFAALPSKAHWSSSRKWDPDIGSHIQPNKTLLWALSHGVSPCRTPVSRHNKWLVDEKRVLTAPIPVLRQIITLISFETQVYDRVPPQSPGITRGSLIRTRVLTAPIPVLRQIITRLIFDRAHRYPGETNKLGEICQN